MAQMSVVLRNRRNTHHGIPSVQNYVSKFKRIVALAEEGYDINTIAFLVKLSTSLVQTYYELYGKNNIISHRRKELESFLKNGAVQVLERRFH